VIPARPYRPRDKAKAEVSVLIAQRWVLARLRNRTFFSLAELNQAIRELLVWANNRPMRKLGISRRELFESTDRPALRPLPPSRYELAEWATPTANIDYHVEIDHNFYSVPHQLRGEKLDARFTQTTVEIFLKSRRVASHARLRGRGRYSTNPEWSPSRLISWAGKAGPAAAELVTHILRNRPHPEQGYRACLGIMHLGRQYGNDRLEAACRRAGHLRAFSYRTVRNILRSGTDRLPLEQDPAPAPELPLHGNIRGAAYYEDPRKEGASC
jgi:transposase